MPCQQDYLDATRSRLDALVADLQATGAPVVLLTAPGSSLSWVLERVKPGMAERVACTNQQLRDIAADTPEVVRVLDSFGLPHTDRDTVGPTHVFNLGHGISQHTPPEHVSALVEAVHSHSRNQRV